MGKESDSIELCLKSFYGIISGKVLDVRDWMKFRELFIEKAVLSICIKDDRGFPGINSFTIDEYIDRLRVFLAKKDFFEYSVSNDIRVYGDICSVCNEYEAYANSEKKTILKKGKNIVSMVFNGEKWKIASMLWEDGA